MAAGLRDVTQIRQGLDVFHAECEEVRDGGGVGVDEIDSRMVSYFNKGRQLSIDVAVETKANNGFRVC